MNTPHDNSGPVAGVLDVRDSHAQIRGSDYQTDPDQPYVPMSLVKRYGLRSGDEITGAAQDAGVEPAPRTGRDNHRDRQVRRGGRERGYALVRVDTVNGRSPEAAKGRPDFHELTPLHPQQRLRMETDPNNLTTRVIDLVTPIGKGQRALIVAPPKAGKTLVLQAIANAVARNNPECHLMVILVDERPEEVTDMQRSIKGEVIASTFDRPPQEHIALAELAIERAKRLVELGQDVVVLLDSLTRLGRAYNLAARGNGRTLSGGIDASALNPPKRLLGAARNIEGGGSLTIIASALVETGSAGDNLIFEEFKSTGNAELRLDRRIAERRVFPAVDITSSGTRKEELLLAADELVVVRGLRRALHAMEPQQAMNQLLDHLRRSQSNREFLTQVARSAA